MESKCDRKPPHMSIRVKLFTLFILCYTYLIKNYLLYSYYVIHILLKIIYLSKRTTNLNKNSEINQNINLFRKNNIVVKLGGIDAM